ncbi:MAG: aminotransferase class V-fold PLP-dependent enzyme [Proteobacteria bacterium]|nr:MAG: aminotransferase class V-fold PLP-dependent enzyme [Pseudomonadota bacterium]QKK12409.1 MAG: aminotransferase class V-fold PLP-dependent enzyme [Pseudomonadota bacterium]
MPYRSEFPHEQGLIYLNHAAVAPWPQRAADAVARFAAENAHSGSWNYRRWEATEQQLRERLQRLLNAASSDDIALVKNTSEALSFVAYGLDWAPGDNVVTCIEEFPSNRWVWQSLERFGVETRLAAITECDDPEAALFGLVDERTRLISVSAVQYGTGLRMALERIGTFCRDNEVLFCIDAIQQLGALPFDVQRYQADFVAADGHKWMLGPEGIGVFWVRPDLRERLRLTEVGWHSAEQIVDYTQMEWTLARTAKRFECGSPNMLGIHALNASLELIEEIGMREIANNILKNTSLLIELINNTEGFSLLTPAETDRHAGIVTFGHRELSPRRLCAQLKERRVLCAPRGGGVRFSPHFYTSVSELRQAWSFVQELAKAV